MIHCFTGSTDANVIEVCNVSHSCMEHDARVSKSAVHCAVGGLHEMAVDMILKEVRAIVDIPGQRHIRL